MVSIRDLNQMNMQTLRRIYKLRHALANENKGYNFFELIKLFFVLLSGEMSAATASVKERSLRQFKRIKKKLMKEIEKIRLNGTEFLRG